MPTGIYQHHPNQGFQKGNKINLEKHWKLSEETKRKQGKAKKGRKRPLFSEKWRRNMSLAQKNNPTCYWLGKHRPKETNDKISKSHKGKKKPWKSRDMKGEKNINWRGGIQYEPYGIEFNEERKEKIRNKFGRKCFECNITEDKLGYKLSIHHIDYDKKNNSEDNLIPLCNSCHMKTGFKRKDWENYFMSRL